MIRALSLLVLVFVCPLSMAATETHVGQVYIRANAQQLKSFVEGSDFQRQSVSAMPADLRAEMAAQFYGDNDYNSYDLEKIVWTYSAVPLTIEIQILNGPSYSGFLGYMFAGYLYKQEQTPEAIEESEALQKKSEQALRSQLAKQFESDSISNQFLFSRHNRSGGPQLFGYLYNNGVGGGLKLLTAPILAERLQQQNASDLAVWKIGEQLHTLQSAEIPYLINGQHVLVTVKKDSMESPTLEGIQAVLPESLLFNTKHEIDLLQTATWALIAKPALTVEEDFYLLKFSQVVQRLQYDLNFYKKNSSRVQRLLAQVQRLKGMIALLQSPHSQVNTATFLGEVGIIRILDGKKRGKTMTFMDAVRELDQTLNKVMFESLDRLSGRCEMFLIAEDYKAIF